MTLTQWHSPDTKPVRVGLYQIRAARDLDLALWSWWNGERWGYTEYYADHAYKYRDTPSLTQAKTWRGLTKDSK